MHATAKAIGKFFKRLFGVKVKPAVVIPEREARNRKMVITQTKPRPTTGIALYYRPLDVCVDYNDTHALFNK